MTLSMSKPGFESQLGYKLVYIFRGGYSSIGKTAILHIVILGSSPNISKWKFFVYIINNASHNLC